MAWHAVSSASLSACVSYVLQQALKWCGTTEGAYVGPRGAEGGGGCQGILCRQELEAEGQEEGWLTLDDRVDS